MVISRCPGTNVGFTGHSMGRECRHWHQQNRKYSVTNHQITSHFKYRYILKYIILTRINLELSGVFTIQLSSTDSVFNVDMRYESVEACGVREESFEACGVRYESFEACGVRYESFEACGIRYESFKACGVR